MTTTAPHVTPTGSSTPGSRAKARGLRVAGRSLPLLPATILLTIFLVGPIIVSLWGSLTDATLSGTSAVSTTFVGLDNYVALFQDPDFPIAVVNTVVFVLFSAVIGQNILGLGLAFLMRGASRVVGAVVGTIVVTAWVLPEIVAAFAMYAFFRDDGSLNTALELFGVPTTSWLYEFPMLIVIIANIWRGTAFSMMVYSAALADVPPEITEAAQMDGASGAKRLFLITIPMIRPTIATNSMIVTLQTLSVFTLIFVMTGGGPGVNSTTLPILAYQEAFKFGQLGFGTAIATIMLIVGAVFSIFYIRALRSETR
ncbi:sugar ABC transporter permease [Microbacterium sp. SSW1-59]|uniref:carbohydrate ABC transporter permease n=1 Tax=Microbacterium xanthum TaxID=3079794 RepID=UPI002AD47DBD|nr:sugar ABC transporter permease [Microbacterium sp. SSW1-59]MDZ8201399.1 sugar ABC transporter permease [Microbacterium sp. SSW1-59]